MAEVQARDSAGSVGTLSVQLQVQDINDHSPEFSATSYSGQIQENTISGVSVLALTATDKDGPQWDVLEYGIVYEDKMGDVAQEYFRMVSQTISGQTVGVLETRKPIDRELFSSLEFDVYVRDKGGRIGITSVDLEILDVLDSPPIFDPDFFNMAVPFDAPVGYKVGRIRAVDPDICEWNN